MIRNFLSKMTFRSKILSVLLFTTIILSSFSLILINAIGEISTISDKVRNDDFPALIWISHWEHELKMKEAIVLEDGLREEMCCGFVEKYETFIYVYANEDMTKYGEIPDSLKRYKHELDLLDFKIVNNIQGLLAMESNEAAVNFINDEYIPKLNELQLALEEEKRAVYSKLSTHDGTFTGIIRESLLLLVVLFTGAIIFGIVSSYRLSAGLTKPVEQMVEKVDRIANGQYGLSVDSTDQIELQYLTKSINQMSLSLKESFDTIMTDKNYREQILNSLPVGIITVDERNSDISLNQTAKQLFEKDEAVFFYELDSVPIEQTNSQFWSIFHSKKIVTNVKVVFKSKEEEGLSLLVSQSRLYDQHKTTIGRLFYFIDITGTEEMERLMQQSKNLALVGELAAGAAHEIRNPLAVIDGFLSLMEHSFTEAERDKFHVQLLTKELERINEIIEDMLLLSKPQVPQFQETCLRDTINEILPLINEGRGNEKLEFDIQLASEKVWVDPKQMKQVFHNLIRNSADALDGSGEICISSYVESGHYHILVKDNGKGVPEEIQDTIFEPFLTSKESGTGLGLPIVKRIIDGHHGEISLYKSSHEGTIFKISLPLSNR